MSILRRFIAGAAGGPRAALTIDDFSHVGRAHFASISSRRIY
jgi:hypothetical protein